MKTVFYSVALFCAITLALVPATRTQQVPISTAATISKHDIVNNLLNNAVTIRHGEIHGSGTIITKKIHGKEYNFILTCGHVVEGLVNAEGIIDDTNLFATQPEYSSGKIVGNREYKLKVLQYEGHVGEDVAVLLVEDEIIVNTSTKFAPDDWKPRVGDNVYHIGTPNHLDLTNSMLFGHISNIGRVIEHRIYVQLQAGIAGGCSGGGVFNEQGEYIGMVCRSAGESYGFAIPLDRINRYLIKNGFGWLTDSAIAVPADFALDNG